MKKIFSLLLTCLLAQAAWPQSGEGYDPENPADPDLYYKLTVEAAPRSGGSVSPSSPTQLAAGETRTCYATPKMGYEFKQWTIGDSVVSTNSSFTLTMPESDVVLTAWFEWNPVYDPENPGDPDSKGYSHHVRLYASPATGGYFNSSNFTLVEGEATRVYAYPRDGYRFESWMVGGEVVSTDNPMSIRMGEADMAFTAAFAYNPENPVNPGANTFNPATGEVVVDDFTPGNLSSAIRNAVGDSYDAVQSITVVGRMSSEDFGFAYRYTNCAIIDLSRTTGYNEVPSWAFEDTKALTTLYLPMSVERIGKKAFEGCDALTDIYLYANTPPALDADALYGLPANVAIHVPAAAVELYKKTEGWSSLNIVPLDTNEKTITVNLPGEGGDYKNLTLELYNVQSGQTYKYLITDRTTYTYYGLMSNTFYELYVKNTKGDILGRMENIHLEEEDLTVTMPTIRNVWNATVTVLSPEGDNLTGDIGVTWYDMQGNYICQGRTVREQAEGAMVRCQLKLSSELAQTYRQPTDSIYAIGGQGENGNIEVTYTLTKLGKAILKGCVKDEDTGTGIAGASVSISQTLNGGLFKTYVVETDRNGNFTAEVGQAPAKLAVAAFNYLTNTMEVELSDEETTLDDILLTSLIGVTITADFTYTTSVIEGEEPTTEDWYTDYQNVSFNIFNETTGKEVTQVSMRFPQMVVFDGVETGDHLRMTATSRTDAFDEIAVSATVDSTKNAYVTFPIVERGGVTASFIKSDNPTVRAILYDSNGKLLQSNPFNNEATATFKGLKDGTYTLVAMGEDPVFNSIYNLAQFASVGLVEGLDYLKEVVTIKKGVIESIDMGDIPLLDTTKFQYVGDNSYFQTNKASVMAGNYIAFNSRIDFLVENVRNLDAKLIVDLPESAIFVDNSVKVGSNAASYEVNGHQLAISLEDDQLAQGGKICFCVIPTKSGEFAPSALLQFTAGGSQQTMAIGAAYYIVEDMEFYIPAVSGQKNIPIRGVAPTGANIKIYDNDVLIGQVTAPASGEWYANCELYDAYNLSSHNLYAKVMANGVEFLTEAKECQYDMNAIRAKNVEMTYYNGWLKKNIIVDFDLENSKVTPSSYQYFKAGDCSFVIDFTENDTTKISQTDLYVFTDKRNTIRCEATYDEKGYWIANEMFDYNKGFPIGVSVDFVSKTEKKADRERFDNQIIAKEKKKSEILQTRDSVQNANKDIASIEIEAVKTDSLLASLSEKIAAELSKDKREYDVLDELLAAYLSLTGTVYTASDFKTDSIEVWNKTVLEKMIADADNLLSQEDDIDFLIEEAEIILAESKQINADEAIQEYERDLFKAESDTIYFEEDGVDKRYYEANYESIIQLGLNEENLIEMPMTDSSNLKVYENDGNVIIIDEKGKKAWVIEVINTVNQNKIVLAGQDVIGKLTNAINFIQKTITAITNFANGLADPIRKELRDIEKEISKIEDWKIFYRSQITNIEKEIVDIENQISQFDQLPTSYNELYDESGIKYQELQTKRFQLEKQLNQKIEKIKSLNWEINQLNKESINLNKSRILKLGILGSIMDIIQIGQGLWQTINILNYGIQDMVKWSNFINSINENYNCKDQNESTSLSNQAKEIKKQSENDSRRFGARYASACAITTASTSINAVLSFNKGVGWIVKMLTSQISSIVNEVANNIYTIAKGESANTYNIRVKQVSNLRCKDKKKEEKKEEPKPQPPYSTPIADPSGYVYEGVSTNRLEGVTATAYYMGSTEDMYGVIHEEPVVWDASEYDQENPLYTDENGMYQWDVPQGLWQVKYEKEGYETTYSEWLPVPPPQLDVNIAMTQNRQPEVKSAHAYTDGVEVTFDKYMLPSLLTPDNIMVSQGGDYVEGTVSLLDEEVSYADTMVTYASKVRFIPTQPFTAGEVTLMVTNRVRSYADIPMQDTFMQTFDIEPELTAIVADSLVTVAYEGELAVKVSVLPAEAASGKTLKVHSSSSLLLSVEQEEYVLDELGEATITIRGELPGTTALTYSINGYDLTATTMVNIEWVSITPCAAPTASVASGSTVAAGTAIYLTCATEGATIYYTLDGTCPCDATDSRKTYDGTPIIVNSDITIKAMATAPGYEDSEVVELVYLVPDAIADLSDGGTLRLYPTPMRGVLHVSVEGKVIRTVTLIAADGSEVFTTTSDVTEATIDTSHLRPGVYVVDVRTNDSHLRRKVVKAW